MAFCLDERCFLDFKKGLIFRRENRANRSMPLCGQKVLILLTYAACERLHVTFGETFSKSYLDAKMGTSPP